jgi:hypothetical protein
MVQAIDLGTKMANVNRLLYDASDSNRYATFFYAELHCSVDLFPMFVSLIGVEQPPQNTARA